MLHFITGLFLTHNFVMLVIMHLLDCTKFNMNQGTAGKSKPMWVNKENVCEASLNIHIFCFLKKCSQHNFFLLRPAYYKNAEGKKKKEQWCQQINVCFNVHKQQSSIIEVLNIHFPGRSVSKLKQLTSSVGLIDICQKWKSSQTEQRFT